MIFAVAEKAREAQVIVDITYDNSFWGAVYYKYLQKLFVAYSYIHVSIVVSTLASVDKMNTSSVHNIQSTIYSQMVSVKVQREYSSLYTTNMHIILPVQKCSFGSAIHKYMWIVRYGPYLTIHIYLWIALPVKDLICHYVEDLSFTD